jgi:hypothetical protein
MSLSNTKIAVLGHCDDQYSNIRLRDFLSFVRLQNLRCISERYQSDIFAEARAYFCDNLFNNEQFVGTVTASWNHKYSGINRIDSFDSWESTKRLFCEENVILCADTVAINAWYNGEYPLIRHIGFVNYKSILEYFSKLGGIIPDDSCDIHVPLSNQIITSKDVYKRKVDFIRYYLSEITDRFFQDPDMFYIDTMLSKSRPLGYISEFLSAMWYYQERDKYTILPSEKLASGWYSANYMNKRHRLNKFSRSGPRIKIH